MTTDINNFSGSSQSCSSSVNIANNRNCKFTKRVKPAKERQKDKFTGYRVDKVLAAVLDNILPPLVLVSFFLVVVDTKYYVPIVLNHPLGKYFNTFQPNFFWERTRIPLLYTHSTMLPNNLLLKLQIYSPQHCAPLPPLHHCCLYYKVIFTAQL